MGLLRSVVALLREPSPQREQQHKLREAKLLLVEHACHLEYYSHSVAMLTERIARIESQSAPDPAPLRTQVTYTDAADDPGHERISATQIPQFSAHVPQRHVNGATPWT
jgi:hypothetical protein